jgi:formate-dependent nitrite reductase membrane component NrfD
MTKNAPIESIESTKHDHFEDILIAFGIAIAAYVGAYIRVGNGYYQIW